MAKPQLAATVIGKGRLVVDACREQYKIPLHLLLIVVLVMGVADGVLTFLRDWESPFWMFKPVLALAHVARFCQVKFE